MEAKTIITAITIESRRIILFARLVLFSELIINLHPCYSPFRENRSMDNIQRDYS